MDINWKWSISGCVAAMYCINSEVKKKLCLDYIFAVLSAVKSIMNSSIHKDDTHQICTDLAIFIMLQQEVEAEWIFTIAINMDFLFF